jgi:hypothetical protein
VTRRVLDWFLRLYPPAALLVITALWFNYRASDEFGGSSTAAQARDTSVGYPTTGSRAPVVALASLPLSMQLDQSRVIAVVAACRAPRDSLEAILRRVIQDSTATVYPMYMSCSRPQNVRLTGQHFAVTPLHQNPARTAPKWPGRQLWTWDITPTKPGQRLLFLEILNSPPERGRYDVLAFEDDVYWRMNVEATWTQWAAGFFDDIGAPLIVMAVVFFATLAWRKVGFPT